MVRATAGQSELGVVAVDGFFLVSGYLVYLSWGRSRSAGAFVAKRALRIYPAYLVVLGFTAAAAAVSAGPRAAAYLRSLAFFHDRVLAAAVYFVPGGLDGGAVYPHNPMPGIANGSLWTLRHEVQCYAVVLLLGSVGLLGRRSVAAMAAGSYLLLAASAVLHLQTDHVRFLAYFFLGAAAADLPAGVFRLTLPRAGLAAAVLAAGARMPPYFPAVAPPALCYLIFAVAFAPVKVGPGLFARWDLSYGVYLYGWPVQQLVVSAGASTPLAVFALSVPPVLLLAGLSWRFVEAPALALKPRDGPAAAGPPDPAVGESESPAPHLKAARAGPAAEEPR